MLCPMFHFDINTPAVGYIKIDRKGKIAGIRTLGCRLIDAESEIFAGARKAESAKSGFITLSQCQLDTLRGRYTRF